MCADTSSAVRRRIQAGLDPPRLVLVQVRAHATRARARSGMELGMDMIFGVNWGKLFGIDTPLLEIFLRGSIMYLGIFALLRLVLRRESGALGITDLLVVVLIADAAQNAMADDYHSITDGVLLVATIVGWSYALEWLAYHHPRFASLVHPPALLLIKDGEVQRHHLRHELITEDELAGQLRQQGITDPAQVRRSYMESDGRISVITEDDERHDAPEQKQV
jgi:uncharacterized membrane protein YcaP (DUF421 family)